MKTSVALGIVGGLAWSSSLRGWMVQIAGDESGFTWSGTFLLLLVPGAAVGGLLGWAEHLRRSGNLGRRRRGWLVASPVLLASALLDPTIFTALVTSGMGGGAIGVTVLGMSGGYALSGRGPRAARVVAGVVAVLLTVACASVVAEAFSLSTAHGAWIAVHVTSLMGVLCVACSIPHRSSAASLGLEAGTSWADAAGPQSSLGSGNLSR